MSIKFFLNYLPLGKWQSPIELPVWSRTAEMSKGLIIFWFTISEYIGLLGSRLTPLDILGGVLATIVLAWASLAMDSLPRVGGGFEIRLDSTGIWLDLVLEDY